MVRYRIFAYQRCLSAGLREDLYILQWEDGFSVRGRHLRDRIDFVWSSTELNSFHYRQSYRWSWGCWHSARRSM